MPSTDHIDAWLEEGWINRGQHSAAANLLEDEAAERARARRTPKRQQGRGESGLSFASAQADRYRHALQDLGHMRDLVVRALVWREEPEQIAAKDRLSVNDVKVLIRYALTRMQRFYEGVQAA